MKIKTLVMVAFMALSILMESTQSADAMEMNGDDPIIRKIEGMREERILEQIYKSIKEDNVEKLKKLYDAEDVELSSKETFIKKGLAYSLNYGKVNTTEYLLSQYPNIDMNAEVDKGNTFLMSAATSPVRFLINEGCKVGLVDRLLQIPHINVNYQSTKDGYTALMCGVVHKYPRIVESLLQNPTIDVNLKNHEGLTALDLAKDLGYHEIVHLIEAFKKGPEEFWAARYVQRIPLNFVPS